VRAVLIERGRLRRWISLDAAQRYVETLTVVADVRPDPEPGPPLTRDRDDDFIIYLARAHGAEVIVSGDADLLEWPEQRPPVGTPAQFESMLSGR